MVAVPLLALLAVAGSRLAGVGASEGPARAVPLAGAGVGGSVAAGDAIPKLFVHVVGAVRRPGLFRLKDGTRVADAVARAGGPPRRAARRRSAGDRAASWPGWHAGGARGHVGTGRQGQPRERDSRAARRAARDRPGHRGEDRRLADD